MSKGIAASSREIGDRLQINTKGPGVFRVRVVGIITSKITEQIKHLLKRIKGKYLVNGSRGSMKKLLSILRQGKTAEVKIV